MMDWEFTTIKTNRGVFETAGGGVSAIGDEMGPCEYVVLAECECSSATYGIYGYGHTEEQAKQSVDLKIIEFETRNILNPNCKCVPYEHQ